MARVIVKGAKAAVFNREYRQRIVKAKRGKGSYERKSKHAKNAD